MTKKAFLVGINDYSPVGTGGKDLNGCVNDVCDMANTLVICGFPANKILIRNIDRIRGHHDQGKLLLLQAHF